MAYNKTFHKYENGVCVEKECTSCRIIKTAENYHKIATTRSGLRSKCIVCYNLMFTERRKTKEHKEKARLLLNNWRRNNPEKAKNQPSHKKYINSQKAKQTRLAYSRKHRAKYSALDALRRQKIKCSEISKIHKIDIEKIYQKCFVMKRETGTEYCVDHIIPINHENVCGLHVPWNLQILTKKENSIKINKFDGTNENESWRKNVKN